MPLSGLLKSEDVTVCCVDPKAVKNNRKTLRGNQSKTDVKDAYSVVDLLLQGKFFFPVERDADMEMAHRLMKRYETCRVQTYRIQNRLRETVYMAFPEFEEMIVTFTKKTVIPFLKQNPTPESILNLGRETFLERWEGRHGSWGRSRFEEIYELAKQSIGGKESLR